MDTSEQVAIETAKRVKRWRRSVEEKRRIVEETLAAGASVARVARRHAVNANQVFYWRKKYREGRLGKASSSNLLPVTISEIPTNKSGQVRGVGAAMHFGDDGNPASEGTTSCYGQCGSRSTAHRAGVFARMIGLPAGTRIWIAAGVTDLRRGFTGLSGMVQTALQENPFSGQVFRISWTARRFDQDCCGGTAMVFVFSRRDWSAEDFSGRKRRAERSR